MRMLVPVQHEEAEQSFGVLSVFFSSEVSSGFQVLQCYALRKGGSKEKAVDENAMGPWFGNMEVDYGSMRRMKSCPQTGSRHSSWSFLPSKTRGHCRGIGLDDL